MENCASPITREAVSFLVEQRDERAGSGSPTWACAWPSRVRYGHERVTAWQDGADAQRKNTAGGFVSSGRARAPDGALARLSQTTQTV